MGRYLGTDYRLERLEEKVRSNTCGICCAFFLGGILLGLTALVFWEAWWQSEGFRKPMPVPRKKADESGWHYEIRRRMPRGLDRNNGEETP